MDRLVRVAARLVRRTRRAWERRWSFLGLFVLCFFVSVLTLGRLDLLPEAPAPAAEAAGSPLVATTTAPADTTGALAELPMKVMIPAIGLTASVANPTTTDIGALDTALLSGAVRYPTSALLGEEGNVVLFGHSSYLPVVNNKAYKTFDGIQKLVAGDLIMVYSSDQVYTYKVEAVAKEDAATAAIPLAVSGKVLTLSTCDSFGEKSDRFVVTAAFVGSERISSS